MIHRALFDVLSAGVAAAKANPDLLDPLFELQFPIEATERAKIKAYLAAEGLTVVTGYPRKAADFPLVAIILASEQETDNWIGDFAGMTGIGEDIISSNWEYRFHLVILTEHPDITAAYYQIVKEILLSALRDLVEDLNAFQFRFSGADLAPDPRYIPEHIFGRQLVFTCQQEFSRALPDSELGRAWKVDGLHVDRSGSLADVGDVRDQLVPYSMGDEDE